MQKNHESIFRNLRYGGKEKEGDFRRFQISFLPQNYKTN